MGFCFKIYRPTRSATLAPIGQLRQHSNASCEMSKVQRHFTSGPNLIRIFSVGDRVEMSMLVLISNINCVTPYEHDECDS